MRMADTASDGLNEFVMTHVKRAIGFRASEESVIFPRLVCTFADLSSCKKGLEPLATYLKEKANG